MSPSQSSASRLSCRLDLAFGINSSSYIILITQGSEANCDNVMAAGKEDLLALSNFAVVKIKQLAVVILEKKL